MDRFNRHPPAEKNPQIAFFFSLSFLDLSIPRRLSYCLSGYSFRINIPIPEELILFFQAEMPIGWQLHTTFSSTRPKFTERSGVNFGLALLCEVLFYLGLNMPAFSKLFGRGAGVNANQFASRSLSHSSKLVVKNSQASHLTTLSGPNIVCKRTKLGLSSAS